MIFYNFKNFLHCDLWTLLHFVFCMTLCDFLKIEWNSAASKAPMLGFEMLLFFRFSLYLGNNKIYSNIKNTKKKREHNIIKDSCLFSTTTETSLLLYTINCCWSSVTLYNLCTLNDPPLGYTSSLKNIYMCNCFQGLYMQH